MKAFNLEEYLKNPDKKVVTRDGRPVRIVCTDREHEHPIIALIKEKDDTEVIYDYNEQGEFLDNDCSNADLMFASEKKTGWVNIYNRATRGCGLIYESEEKAKQNADKDKPYVATTKIEWEE